MAMADSTAVVGTAQTDASGDDDATVMLDAFSNRVDASANGASIEQRVIVADLDANEASNGQEDVVTALGANETSSGQKLIVAVAEPDANEASSGQDVIVAEVEVEKQNPMEIEEEKDNEKRLEVAATTTPHPPPNCGNKKVNLITKTKDKLEVIFSEIQGQIKTLNKMAEPERQTDELQNLKKKEDTLNRMATMNLVLRVGDLTGKMCETEVRMEVLESKTNKTDAKYENLKAELELLKNQQVVEVRKVKNAETQTEPEQSGNQNDAQTQTATENTEKSQNPLQNQSSLPPSQPRHRQDQQDEYQDKDSPNPSPTLPLVLEPETSPSEIIDKQQEQQGQEGGMEISTDSSQIEGQLPLGEHHAPIVSTPLAHSDSVEFEIGEVEVPASTRPKRKSETAIPLEIGIGGTKAAEEHSQLTPSQNPTPKPPASTSTIPKRKRKSETAKRLEIGTGGTKTAEEHSQLKKQNPSPKPPAPASTSTRPKRKRKSAIATATPTTAASNSEGAGKPENETDRGPPPTKKSKGTAKVSLTSDLGKNKKKQVKSEKKPVPKVSRKKSTTTPSSKSTPTTKSNAAGTPEINQQFQEMFNAVIASASKNSVYFTPVSTPMPTISSSNLSQQNSNSNEETEVEEEPKSEAAATEAPNLTDNNEDVNRVKKAATSGRKRYRPIMFQGRRKKQLKTKKTPGSNQKEAVTAKKRVSKSAGSKGPTPKVDSLADDEVDGVLKGGSSVMEDSGIFAESSGGASQSQVESSQGSGKGQDRRKRKKRHSSAANRSSKRSKESNLPSSSKFVGCEQIFPAAVGEVEDQSDDYDEVSLSAGNEEGKGQGVIITEEFDLLEEELPLSKMSAETDTDSDSVSGNENAKWPSFDLESDPDELLDI